MGIPLEHFITITRKLLKLLKESVNAEEFGKYAEGTSHLLEATYPDKKMTPTVHKMLGHGKDLIEYQSLPIGELSEEAQEAKNKEYKKFRYSNPLKFQGRNQVRIYFVCWRHLLILFWLR
ncbi:uncharacterized protein LOC120322325 [Drosophila yakuba]|uniref:uncharacterized protein LOC120322325 n=1 Tax=Drosophila yakuba TaxID=7245 RepID=UPI0019307C0B|nr:uncharacterized protein LOC120322325 [Drosophila yakuba]